jgi:hypothetical protein
MRQLDHQHVPNSSRTSKALPVQERGLRGAVAFPLAQSSQNQHCKNPIPWIAANRFESTAGLGRSGVAEALVCATEKGRIVVGASDRFLSQTPPGTARRSARMARGEFA